MSKRYQGGVLGVGFNPLQAPNAPTIGAATAGNTTVSVAFTAPANVGGSAISTYAVRVSPGNVSATGSSSPISVTGLTNDTTYTFSVAALNSYGPSPYSGTVTATPFLLAVEDYFSTYLYAGNDGAQTITNGINLSGQGGMVWVKSRNAAFYNALNDTARGAGNVLQSQSTAANFNQGSAGLSAFTSSGFSVGSDNGYNSSSYNYASWSFRKQPNFFDVVTWTGTGATGNVSHNLGVAPAVIIAKRTDSTGNWAVYHKDANAGPNASATYLNLNSTAAAANSVSTDGDAFDLWGPPTSTQFRASNRNAVLLNQSGATYVAYLFASNTASDGFIQCGSYTGNGSSTGPIVTLGWEPQWLLIKSASTATDWWIVDNMRGFTYDQANAGLQANSSNAESSLSAPGQVRPLPTGFQLNNTGSGFNNSGSTYVYIAIRRGPMKTPTLGTSVYESVAYSGNNTAQRVIGSTALTDTLWLSARNANSPGWSANYAHYAFDRLRGDAVSLATSKTAAEISGWGSYIDFDRNTGWDTGPTTDYAYINGTGTDYLSRSFKRAPGFFDEVCYTGNGAARTINHNLGVAPELTFFKSRSGTAAWYVLYDANASNAKYATLNTTDAGATATYGAGNAWSGQPTATTLSLGSFGDLNGSGQNYVAYLFASCPGVSKVGSYTGNGTSQTINCGFSSTARFILIKRTDNTGDWYTWDAATGLVAGNDPHLSLNTAAAEVTTDDSVDTNSTGFIVNQDAATNINVNGATYIFLAIS